MITPVPLSDVRVSDAYAVRAHALEVSYLLSLDTGRLLAGFYENAGISTPYARYGGWESLLIGGHTLGHYLSACAHSFATAGEEREALSSRIQTVVHGLAVCQRAVGSGLVWGASPVQGGVEAQFDNVERGKTNIEREAWVPWYTLHKLLAGLLDAYALAGNDEALSVADGLGDWVAARVLRWDKRLQNKVLSVEYGGMNEAMYRLYSHTKKQAHARAAHMFDEEKLFDDVLSERRDVLKDKHANTTIPKILGALARYRVLHETASVGENDNIYRYLNVAKTFFRMVVERHTYATGGNSEWEHFGADFVLDAERTNCNCETCNVYNMMKLARGLFAETGERQYLDYYDNAFTNAILSSQNPETGMTTYFQPMAGGFFKVYSRPYDNFWCCTGSGMENFSKLGDGIWYESGDRLLLARYLSCRLKTEHAEVALTCAFPFDDTAKISIIHGERVRLSLLLPCWRAGDAVLTINGAEHICGGDYAEFEAGAGDEISLRIPVTVTAQPLPDAPDTVAFRYGGALLSCGLGDEDMQETETGVGVTIPKRRILPTESVYFDDAEAVLRSPEKFFTREGETFVLHGDVDLRFGVHYKKYKERYAIYYRIRQGARQEEKEERAPLDAVQPGYGQYETDALHSLDEKNSVGVTSDGTYRYARAGGYFAYDLRVAADADNLLEFSLRRADNGKTLKITAGGEEIFAERLLYTMGEEEYVRTVTIPAQTVARHAWKKQVDGREETVLTLRFSGFSGRASAKVCEFLRIYRS